MSVTEFQRHQLFQWFEEAMGSERAATMMEVLPPVNWTDVATKHDLRAELSALRGELLDRSAQQARTLFLAMLASNATLVGLVFTAVRLG